MASLKLIGIVFVTVGCVAVRAGQYLSAQSLPDPCTRCGGISITWVSALGSPDSSLRLIGVPTSVTRSEQGVYYISDPHSFAPPLLFDGLGQRLPSPTGTDSTHLKNIRTILPLGGDTITAFDLDSRRIAIIEGDSLLKIGDPIGFYVQDVVRSASGFVLNGVPTDPQRFGFLLHRYDANLNYVRSYEAVSGSFRVPRPTDARRILASSSHGSVWAAEETDRIRLSLFDTLGVPVVQLEVRPDWYTPRKERTRVTPDTPPEGRLTVISEDAQGLLWLFGRVPATDWREGLGPPTSGPDGSVWYPILSVDRVYDGTVEIINPQNGSTLTSVILDVPVEYVISRDLFGTLRSDSIGVFAVDVWEMRFSR